MPIGIEKKITIYVSFSSFGPEKLYLWKKNIYSDFLRVFHVFLRFYSHLTVYMHVFIPTFRFYLAERLSAFDMVGINAPF